MKTDYLDVVQFHASPVAGAITGRQAINAAVRPI
jgi:hypothetical protein